MAIDDPLDQAQKQSRSSEGSSLLSPILNLAGLLVGVFHGGSTAEVAAGTAALAVVWELIDSRRQSAGASTMFDALVEAYRDANGRIDGIDTKLRGLDAEEAFVKGARAAVMTARLDKARRIGRILGSTLASDSPNWAEAAEFIGDIESFGEEDIGALKLLWVHQRGAFRIGTGADRKMSTDANDYTIRWKEVMAAVSVAQIHPEEWYSRCGRLVGFGLVLPVLANPSHQSPSDSCFRLTTRAVRFLNALGYPAAYGNYPKVIYKPGGVSRTVNDFDEHMNAGEGWFETPRP